MNIRTTAGLPTDGGRLTFPATGEGTLHADAAGVRGCDAPALMALVNALLRAGPEGVEAALGDVLERLAALAGADWICILRGDGDGRAARHWAGAGLDPLPCLPDDAIADWESDLRAGRPVLLADLSALAARAPMQALARDHGVGSVLLLPLVAGGARTGLVALAARQALSTPPESVALLQAAAEAVDTALARRAAEERHRNTALRLEATLAALPDLLFELRADGTFTGFAAGPVELMVTRPEHLPGRHFTEFLPPDAAEVVTRALDEVMEKGRVGGVRYRLDLGAGNPHWFELAGAKTAQAGDGEPTIIFVVRDVSSDAHLRNELARLARTATEAHERLENAIRSLPDGVVILDDANRVVGANPAYRTMFPALVPHVTAGTALEDVLRAAGRLGVFGPGPDPDAVEAWVAERVAAYALPYKVDEVQIPDGRWIRRIHTRTDDGGCIAVAIDVTARRNQIDALDAANRELTHALAERDRAERRLLSIIEGSEVGTWELDIPSDRLRVGGHWAEMLGRTGRAQADLSVTDFLSLVHAEDRPRLLQMRGTQTSQTDEIVEAEFRMRHADGHWVWVLSRSRIVQRGADGRPTTVAGVHIDISDRKRLEEEIRSSRAYLSEVMDTSIAALAVLDDEGRILYVNLEAERILGLSRADVRGRVYNDPVWRIERLDGGPLPDEDLPYRRAIASGSARDLRFAIHWPDGTRRELSANAVPLTLPDGAVQVVVSFSDITDQLAATHRLEEARAKAEEMSRAKSVFLANMSHEIRTPLNGVLGMAEVLDTLIDAPEQKQMVATIRRSGETLLTVLNSILDMSKIEAGKMVLEEVPLLPADILSQVEALHLVQAEEKGLEFEVLASAGADRPRLGDPHRITQILNNLLSNAIKFTEAGSVTLKLGCRAGRPVVIEVSDTGVGMTEAQAARVFESFEQADGSMTRRFGGTGLGLSIVRELVGLMGGSVEVQSRLGEGTRVRVTLPLPECEARPVAMPEAEDLPDPTLLKGRHVLIADDNVTNRIVLSEMLAQTGVRMALVENGQDAVTAWNRARDEGDPFDLLLLDITMPVLDGLRALVEIRQREAAAGIGAVPAIAVTANAMPNQVADYIMGGFDTHLAKPFKRKDLLHAIRTLLR